MKKRKDCFFGLHSDFHTIPELGTVGATLREEDIREICQLLKPDFWQIDCKGHPGWASYPSNIGNAMPDFALDTLALWRKVTREEDVSLYMHYSGVLDQNYAAKHPENCVLNADGTRDIRATKVNGPYVDEILIPQICEVAEKYGVNGVWTDGECWGTQPDYSPDTLAAFEKETGICLNGKPPVKRGDPYFNEFREYCRELFRRYLRHYVDTLHEKHPDLEIASNWMFSDHAPEKICANVDFLSGDLDPWNSFNSARYAGRALAQQNHTWDLMAIDHRGGAPQRVMRLPLAPIQFLQEAAAVISLGGGFQVDVLQFGDGSPNMNSLRALAPLAKFMREREAYCFRGKLVHQAALLLSTHDRLLESEGLYYRNGNEKQFGLTSLLCDAGQSLEIVSEHTLEGRYGDYPMIVVPEVFDSLAPQTVTELLLYAKNGGSLLLVGPKTCKLFSDAGAPFTTISEPEFPPYVASYVFPPAVVPQKHFTLDGSAFGVAQYPAAIEAENLQVLARTQFNMQHGPSYPLAGILPYGKGKIAVIAADFGSQYYTSAQYLHRVLLHRICDALYTPLARIESALGNLEIVCLKKNDRLMLQLINANGSHSNTAVANDDILPPVLDMELSIAMPAAPQKLMLRPENREIPFTYRDGRVWFRLDRLNIHSVVEVIE